MAQADESFGGGCAAGFLQVLRAELKMIKLACVNCGAPLEVGADMDTFACAYRGTTQMVERKGGTIALRRVEAAIKANGTYFSC